jgi:hypothetical protein
MLSFVGGSGGPMSVCRETFALLAPFAFLIAVALVGLYSMIDTLRRAMELRQRSNVDDAGACRGANCLVTNLADLASTLIAFQN